MSELEGRRGQSLVEFALILGILVWILFGVLDLGRVAQTYIVIKNAAREGAYYGSMHPGDSTAIKGRVVGEAEYSGVTIAPDDVTISHTGASGDPIRVTVTHDVSLLMAWAVGSQSLHLSAFVEMAVI